MTKSLICLSPTTNHRKQFITVTNVKGMGMDSADLVAIMVFIATPQLTKRNIKIALRHFQSPGKSCLLKTRRQRIVPSQLSPTVSEDEQSKNEWDLVSFASQQHQRRTWLDVPDCLEHFQRSLQCQRSLQYSTYVCIQLTGQRWDWNVKGCMAVIAVMVCNPIIQWYASSDLCVFWIVCSNFWLLVQILCSFYGNRLGVL